jgi:anti-anti-sigma regulatory factor
LLSAETVNNALIITLEGELDMHTAPPFKQYIDNQLATNQVIKDLVLRMDKIKFQKRGGRLIFVACSPHVHRILKLSGMQKIAYFTDSVKEALSL